MTIDDIHLTEDEKEMYLDLAPFLNPCPYVVPEDMSLAKVTYFDLKNFCNILYQAQR